MHNYWKVRVSVMPLNLNSSVGVSSTIPCSFYVFKHS